MKVVYEFNIGEEENNDRYDLQVFQLANKMFLALSDIGDYMRTLRKGWVEDGAEQIEDKISNIVYESGIGELE